MAMSCVVLANRFKQVWGQMCVLRAPLPIHLPKQVQYSTENIPGLSCQPNMEEHWSARWVQLPSQLHEETLPHCALDVGCIGQVSSPRDINRAAYCANTFKYFNTKLFKSLKTANTINALCVPAYWFCICLLSDRILRQSVVELNCVLVDLLGLSFQLQS